jgi:hypothetical protein
MKYWIYRLLLVAIVLLAPQRGHAQSKSGVMVEITDEQTSDRTVSMKMRVIDQATGREVAGITERDVVIIQDGAELKESGLRLVATTTDATDPQNHTLPFNSKSPLIASGATIGIVADLSSALNLGAPAGTDYIVEIRQAVEQWISLGNTVAPGDPEAVGVFLPLAFNSQPLQPASAQGFSRDHNAIITALRQEPARDGATDLYDAVLAAVEATATEASRRGTPSYVVVFSDGTVTNKTTDPTDAILRKAEATNTIIIAVGIGNPTSLEKDINRLPKLAPATGGQYIQVAAGDREARIKAAYASLIKPVDRTGYDLAFNHTAPRDGKEHTFQVRVTLNGATWESQSLKIPEIGGPGPSPIQPLSAVQKDYLLLAVPLSVLAAALATLLATLGRKRPTRIELTSDADKTRN